MASCKAEKVWELAGLDRKCTILCIPAVRMIGVPRRKENRAAVVCDRWVNSPPAIVMPDLEVPGSRAIAWAHPMNRTWPRLRLCMPSAAGFCFAAYRSAARNTSDQTRRFQATKVGLRSSCSITSPKNSPTSPAGNEAQIMYQAKR